MGEDIFQESSLRKIRKFFSLLQYRILLLIVIIFFCMLILIIYIYGPKPVHDIDRFTKLISEYMNLKKHDDEEAAMTIANFQYNDIMLPQYQWNSHTEEFLGLLNEVENIMRCVLNRSSVYYKTEAAWKVIIHTALTVARALPAVPTDQTTPWGTNWYQFSISFPRFLVFAAYLYNSQHAKFHKEMTEYMKTRIAAYIPSPTLSLGYTRDGPNAVMMAVPYLGAHIYARTRNIEKNKGLQSVLKSLSFEIVWKGEGLYADMTYVFHQINEVGLRAYGYLYDSSKDFVLLMSYYNNLKAQRIFQDVRNILEHPTINRHFAPLFTRAPNFRSNEVGKLGFYSIDSAKIISVKQETFLVQFFGQSKKLFWYEADQDNFKLPQMCVMARVMFTNNFPETLPPELSIHLPGVILNGGVHLERKAATSTTVGYECKAAECAIVTMSNVIGMYNKYTIGDLRIGTIEEMVLVTENGILSYYNFILPSTLNSSDLTVSGACSTICEKITKNNNTFYRTAEDIQTFTHKIDDAKLVTINANGTDYHSLKMSLSPENELVFEQTIQEESTFITAEQNYLKTLQNTLVFNGKYLYLYNDEQSKVGIGVFEELPVNTLYLDAAMIERDFGPGSKPAGALKKNNRLQETVYGKRLSTILENYKFLPEYITTTPSELKVKNNVF